MTALLTDEQAAIAAARKYAVSLNQPKTDEYHIRVVGFVVGARFARAHYEAREKLWRELVTVSVAMCDPFANCDEYNANASREEELRLALGIDKEGA